MQVQPKREHHYGIHRRERLYMKSVLFVVLSVFMLSGCGTDNQGSSIGTMDEPSRDENQEAGPRDDSDEGVSENSEVTPSEEENSIIGDDQSDLLDTDTNGHGTDTKRNGTGTTENGTGTNGHGTNTSE